MIDALSMPFMQRAVLGGIMVGLIAGYFGPFIVQRRLAFMGSGLAHAAFGGVALALLLNTEPLWIAVPFTVVVALGIVWVRDRTQLAEDASIGIFFAVSMALGIIFLSLKEGYAADAFTYLFGSILAIAPSDLWVTGTFLLALVFTVPWWQRWAYATFDRNLARADRLPVTRDDYVLFVAIAVAVVVCIKLVGIVLIAAFLVVPPAAARLLTRTFSGMTVVSLVIETVSVLAGLVVSYYADLPSGPTIILTQSAIFLVALIVSLRSQ